MSVLRNTCLLLVPALLPQAAAQDPIADHVVAEVQQARTAAGVGRLERRQELDAIALERAKHVAELPHKQRLRVKQPIEDLLDAAGVGRYRRAALHVDLQRGFLDPGPAYVRSWRRYEQAWGRVLNEDWHAIGLATYKADDHWLILTAVLFQDDTVPTDLPALESAAVAAVNEVRLQHGLRALAPSDYLAGVARGHSAQMARLDYFAHKSPGGRLAQDRVQATGGSFYMLAENIFRGRGMDDPVRAAVQSWMNSKGHRKNILTPEFEQTGIGVATDEDGRIYFTQLFLTPR